MAKRRRATSGRFVRATSSKPTAIVVRTSQPAPVVVRRVGGRRRRRASPKRRSIARRVGAGIISKPRTAIVLGSAALGFANQQKWLEKLPVIGSAGPITSFGLIGWGLEELGHMRLPPLLHDMITSALAISAFNIGNTVGGEGGIKLVGESYPGGAAFYE